MKELLLYMAKNLVDDPDAVTVTETTDEEGTVLERIPVLSSLFSINTPVWILLFTTLYLFTRKDLKKNCIPMMFLLLWLTYMAGPVSCLRYIFPVMIMYPFFIWMWLEREI